jgi:hypothetical protein
LADVKREPVVGVTMMAAVALALAATPACLHSPSSPDPSPCSVGVFADDAGAGTFALVVGAEDSSGREVATAWKDGDHVALVSGGQGGYMIRPSIDVTAPAPLTEVGGQVCLGVRMTAGPPSDRANFAGSNAAHVADTTATYHVAALFGLLSYTRDVDGAAIEIGLDVQQAGGGDGHARFTVVPDSAIPQ